MLPTGNVWAETLVLAIIRLSVTVAVYQKPIRITVRWNKTDKPKPYAVVGWLDDRYPGIAITEDEYDGGTFAISHLRSGLRIIGMFEAFTYAFDAFLRVAPNHDWTRTKEELCADPAIKELVVAYGLETV